MNAPRTRPASHSRAALILLPLLLLLLGASPCPAQSNADAAKANEKTNDAAAPKPPGEAAGARDSRRANVTGSITGRVIGEGGEPLSGVAVRASGRSTGTLFATPPTANTDEEGQFVFENLEPNVYNLSAELPGYVNESDVQPTPPRQRIGDNVTLRMTKGGVLTGTVTDAAGDPLVGVNVRVLRVRDLEGRSTSVGGFGGRDAATDDRGVYRAYGLMPGIYIISAGGAPMWTFMPVPRSENAPTYYPSGTRDTAAELAVRAGQETSGIDIRLRDERGFRISGSFVTPPTSPGDDIGGVSVSLIHAATGTYLASSWVMTRGDADRAFSFEGLADGDYDLSAQQTSRTGVEQQVAPLARQPQGLGRDRHQAHARPDSFAERHALRRASGRGRARARRM